MGEAIITYCYKCKKNTPPLFIGRGIDSMENTFPAQCFNCKEIVSFKMSSPHFSKCGQKVTPIGKFILESRNQEVKPRNLTYDLGIQFMDNKKFGLSFSDLMLKSHFSKWRKFLLHFSKRERHKFK